MASAVFESNCTCLSAGIQGSATVPRGIGKGAMPALPWRMFTGSGQVFNWLSICHLEKLFSVGSRAEVSCHRAILKLVWNVYFRFLVQPWLWGVVHLVHTLHPSHITSLIHHIPHTSYPSHITSLTHHIPHTSHPSHIPHTLHTRDQKTFTLKTTCGMVPFHWWTLIRLTDTQCCICGSPNYQHNWFTTVRDALQPTVRANKIANRGIWAPEPVSLGTRLVRTWRHSTFSGRETLCCGYSCKYICVLKFQGWLQPHNYFNSRFLGSVTTLVLHNATHTHHLGIAETPQVYNVTHATSYKTSPQQEPLIML